jgi:hypothetical protein
VIEEIKGMLITQVIMAGVKWIIGLLNPASAFVKAAMAIYDIVMFFVNQGSQVVELVSAITDAVVAIASGAVGGAAKLVENALAKSLPVVIGFLAKKVQGIVKKVRDRIDLAIDKVLQKAKSLFKGKKGKGKKEQDKRNKDEEGKITEADRKKHEQIATLIKKDLTEKPKKPQQSFEDFYKSKTQQAKKLETKYQPQLKQGIGLEIAVGSIDQEKEDGDLDFKVRIAPNTTELEFPATWESGNGIKEEFIESLKQEYRDILSQDPNSEGIPKYKHLENEIEILREKDAQEAKEHFEKIKKQVEVIRQINKLREEYKALGHPIKTDKVVIYGTYDLTITPKQGTKGVPKHIKGKYNAVSSQETRGLEKTFNQQAETEGKEERMMPTQNQYMRFFKVNPEMVNKARAARLDPKEHFPNPTHDAETKILEYIARQIVKAVHGEPSPEEEQKAEKINEISNSIDERAVPSMKIKQEIENNESTLKGKKETVQSFFEKLQLLSKEILSSEVIVDITNYEQVQVDLKENLGERKELINKIKELESKGVIQRSETYIGLVLGNLVTLVISDIKKLENDIKDLKDRLDSAKNELMNPTAQEAPWLDENDQNTRQLRQHSSEFQTRQNEKLQDVINNWEVSGKIVINDEQDACTSCAGIIEQFLNKLKLPKETIELHVAVRAYYGKEGRK